MKLRRSEARDEALHSASERPKVVYTHPPVQLARLVGKTADGHYEVELGSAVRQAEIDPEVDRALLDEVLARSGRVLVETADGALRIAGVLQTQRTLTIDANGEIDAQLRSLKIRVQREIQLSTDRAFVWVRGENIEIYGREVLTRAREVAKILGRLISLN